MQEMSRSQKLETSLNLLCTWVEENGWAGYDPYDIKGVPALMWMQKYRLLRKGLNVLVESYPHKFRKIFRIRPAVNPKAMALFAMAYLNLFRFEPRETYLGEARECLTWLMENSCSGYSGPCWGYPFDWQSEILIPRGTPCGVVTSFAVRAFLDAHRVLGAQEYLDVAKGCCEFLIKDLNWDEMTPESGCFSYTPMDFFHVHNANLWTAAAVSRVGALTSNRTYLDRARQALKYTLDGQNLDGSWTYRGLPDANLGVVDNYHNGFVLRALLDIYQIDPKPEILAALRKGIHFYRESLLVGDQIPKHTAKRLYPVDIHSCAEAILCCSALSEIFPELLHVAGGVTAWTVEKMQDPTGFFYYRKYHMYTSKIGFIRWGQAWMMLALSEYLLRAHVKVASGCEQPEKY